MRAAWALGIWLTCGAVAAPAGEFDERVAPLLKTRCVRCHGPNQRRGGLDLSTPAGLTRGGESGSILAGETGLDSLLWRRIEANEMPPDQRLSDEERELLRGWLRGGAKGLPAANDSGEHWAFRPLPRRPLPIPVSSAPRVRTRIDALIAARLAERGLEMSADADPATLVRRVHLDVTGLPPTIAEQDLFRDEWQVDPESAYERCVERCLASPGYAERWGKHWLDAAGYADSNGYFSADTDRPLAYRYRDYVLRSFRADKPFDQFVREQLAGDEMAQFQPGQATTLDAIDLLEATHFLRNGQDGTDIGVQEPEAFEIDRRAALEAAVQVTASSLLGLTLHCARCHDHKFEPLTQREYYGFQAILFPAFNPQNWVNPKDRVAYAYLPGEKERWDAEQARIQAELTRIRAEWTAWLKEHREPSELLLAESFDEGWTSRWSATAPGDDRPSGGLTIGEGAAPAAQVVDGQLRILAAAGELWLSTARSFDWTPDEPGAWIQATFDLVDHRVGGNPAERIGYTIAAHDFDDSSGREGGNLLIDGHPMAATSVYRDYPGSDGKVVGQIGQQGYVPGRNYGVRVTNVGGDKFRMEHLVDGLPDGKPLDLASADLPDGGFAFFFCCQRSYVVDELRVERSVARKDDSAELSKLRDEIQRRRQAYEAQRTKLEAERTPEPGRAIAWVTDKSAEPPVVPLLTRGQYHLRGPSVDPIVPAVLSDPGREYRPALTPPPARTTGRRLGFAQWLTADEGRPAALLARVHVNRIWRQYFGRGIVATTDNLGQSGAAPTHPELIDELARRFVDSGWSQRAVHREILLSTAYRQSSAPRADGLERDPDNRWLWRWPLRRMEAETLRDAMLFVAGELDRRPFGPYVPTRQTPVGEVIVDPQTPGANRRTVYLQQRRSQLLSLLKVFDAPSIATVCSTRPASTVPLQSLALLNSDFTVAGGEAFAERLRRDGARDDDTFIELAWRGALSRSPTEAERRMARDFLKSQRTLYPEGEASVRAAADFCQMILASSPFLYIE